MATVSNLGLSQSGMPQSTVLVSTATASPPAAAAEATSQAPPSTSSIVDSAYTQITGANPTTDSQRNAWIDWANTQLSSGQSNQQVMETVVNNFQVGDIMYNSFGSFPGPTDPTLNAYLSSWNSAIQNGQTPDQVKANFTTISNVFQTVFGGPPDPGSFNHYLSVAESEAGNGTSQADIGAQITADLTTGANSAQYQANKSQLQANSLTPAIDQVFQNVFGSAPDPNSLNHYLSVAEGLANQGVSVADIQSQIQASLTTGDNSTQFQADQAAFATSTGNAQQTAAANDLVSQTLGNLGIASASSPTTPPAASSTAPAATAPVSTSAPVSTPAPVATPTSTAATTPTPAPVATPTPTAATTPTPAPTTAAPSAPLYYPPQQPVLASLLGYGNSSGTASNPLASLNAFFPTMGTASTSQLSTGSSTNLLGNSANILGSYANPLGTSSTNPFASLYSTATMSTTFSQMLAADNAMLQQEASWFSGFNQMPAASPMPTNVQAFGLSSMPSQSFGSPTSASSNLLATMYGTPTSTTSQTSAPNSTANANNPWYSLLVSPDYSAMMSNYNSMASSLSTGIGSLGALGIV